MRDEFRRLEELLSFEGEISQEKAKEILAEASSLFEALKEVIFSGTPEEKNEIVRLMTKLNLLVKRQFQAALKQTGLSEEQFLQMAENPQNFSSEQWEKIQQAKSSLTEKSKELSKAVSKAEAFVKEKQGLLKPASSDEEGGSDAMPRAKRKNWIKS